MKLVGIYSVVQWTIVREMVELLEYNDEATIEEWVDKRKEYIDDLNLFVIDILAINRRGVVQAIEQEYNQAYALINEHMNREFDIDAEHDTEQVSRTAEYLNRDIMRALYSTPSQMGIVEETYLGIIESVQNEVKTDEEDYLTIIGSVIYAHLEKGLKSGYVQSDGKVWAMDRTVNQISRNIYQNLYNHVQEQVLHSDVELVRVFQFVRPREACAKLQESGVIAIKPRSELSEENQRYPNVWDAEHKFLEIDGHHGRHCRHAWHSVNSDADNSQKLYNPIDEAMLQLEAYRLRFKNLLQRYI